MEVDALIKRSMDSYHGVLELINRLGASDNRDKSRELAETVQIKLKDYESGVQTLQFYIDDEANSEFKRTHAVTLDRLQENLKLAKMRFRKAQIQAKKNGEQSWKNQREQLFAGKESAVARGEQRSAAMSTEERIIGKSEDITATLRRVHQMARTEVTKSSLNIEDLETSTRALQDLEKRYTAFDVLLRGSSKLVKHLEQADRWDRIYMIASLSFLALTLAWIVWRRILRAPVMLLLWALARMIGLANFIGRTATSSSSSKVAEIIASSVTAASEIASSVTEETVLETVATAVESALHDL